MKTSWTVLDYFARVSQNQTNKKGEGRWQPEKERRSLAVRAKRDEKELRRAPVNRRDAAARRRNPPRKLRRKLRRKPARKVALRRLERRALSPRRRLPGRPPRKPVRRVVLRKPRRNEERPSPPR